MSKARTTKSSPRRHSGPPSKASRPFGIRIPAGLLDDLLAVTALERPPGGLRGLWRPPPAGMSTAAALKAYLLTALSSAVDERLEHNRAVHAWNQRHGAVTVAPRMHRVSPQVRLVPTRTWRPRRWAFAHVAGAGR